MPADRQTRSKRIPTGRQATTPRRTGRGVVVGLEQLAVIRELRRAFGPDQVRILPDLAPPAAVLTSAPVVPLRPPAPPATPAKPGSAPLTYRGRRLTGPVTEFHAAVDALRHDTIPGPPPPATRPARPDRGRAEQARLRFEQQQEQERQR